WFIPINEHLIVTTRLLLAFQLWSDDASNRVLFLAALLAHAVTVAIVLFEVRRRWGGRDAALLSGAAVVLLCTAIPLQSLVFGAAVSFPIGVMWTVLAVHASLNAEGARRPGRWAGIAALCALAASVTIANGIVVPALVGVLMALPRRSVRPF